MSRSLAVLFSAVLVVSMVAATATVPSGASGGQPASEAVPAGSDPVPSAGDTGPGAALANDTGTPTPVFTGVSRPTIDGQLYGHTGQSVPEGRTSEWADGYNESVEFAAAEGQDVQGHVYVKTFARPKETFVGTTGQWAGALDGETLETIRIRLDGDGSGTLSEGDVRLTLRPAESAGEDAEAIRSTGGRQRWVPTAAETFRSTDGEGSWVAIEFEDASAAAAASAVVACCSAEDGVGTLEARIDREMLEAAAGDLSGNDTGVDIEIETDSNSYSLAGDGDRFGVVGRHIDRRQWVEQMPDPEELGVEIRDVGLDRVEITQAVQTRNNDLTLVAGKDTLARAFVTHDHDEAVEMRVTVTAKRATLTRAGGVRTRTIGSRSTTFTAPPGTPDRDDLDDSGNVELPESWTEPRTVVGQSLPRRIEVTVEPVSTIDGSPGNDAGDETVEFVYTYDPNVYLVRVNEGPSSNPELATQREIDAMKERFRETYPVADPNFVQVVPNVLGPQSGQEDINLLGELNELEAFFDTLGGRTSRLPKADVLVGVTEDPRADGALGLATTAYPNGHSGGIAAWSAPLPDTFVHEVNHNIGNNTWGRHVANTSTEVSNGIRYGCGAGGPDGLWAQRYDDGEIHEVGWEPGSGLADPSFSNDFMTYCGNEWVSDYRWEMLVDRFVGFTPGETVHPDLQGGSGGGSSPDTSGEGSTTATRVVSGQLFANGTAELDPSFRLPGNATGGATEVENPQALVVVEYANDTVTRPIRVNRPARAVRGGTVRTADTDPPARSFAITLPARDGIERIRLVDAETDEPLDSLRATDFSVEGAEFGLPAEVERGELTEVEVDLQADAPEGTELVTRPLYVPEGGQFDRPVGDEFRTVLDTGYVVPFGQPSVDGGFATDFEGIPGGEARFLLVVSDGIRTEVVASETVTVPPRPPTVSVDRNQRFEVVEGEEIPDAEPPGQSIEAIERVASPIEVNSGEVVSASASGHDQFARALAGRETGEGEPALQWRLIDASGDTVATDAGRTAAIGGPTPDDPAFAPLQPGEYELRVTATDPSSGLTASDSIRVEVSAPPLPDREVVAAFREAIERSTDDGTAEPAVGFEPTAASVTIEETTTVDVQVTDASGGVGSYELVVNTTDASTARIVGAENRIGGTERIEPTEDESSVRLGAFAGDTADTGTVTVATVTIAGVEPGTAGLELVVDSVSNEAGMGYAITDGDVATVTVREQSPAPEVIAGSPATDPDDDGVFEDVNGDREVTPGDATVLFNAVFEGNEAVANNPERFDLNADGSVTPGDATVLFNEVFG